MTNPEIMARGVAVAACRLRSEGMNPLAADAASALSILQYHPGPIGVWATTCSANEFEHWCRMWRTYQWCRQYELDHGPDGQSLL